MELLARVMQWVGHRGAILVAFAITAFSYGSGLVSGYHPTFAHALHFPMPVFGWGFIAFGILALSGMITRFEKVAFTTSALWTTFWIILLATHWTESFGWTAAISWLGLDLCLIVASGWPEIHIPWREKPQ